jgi:hypothetical protein
VNLADMLFVPHDGAAHELVEERAYSQLVRVGRAHTVTAVIEDAPGQQGW